MRATDGEIPATHLLCTCCGHRIHPAYKGEICHVCGCPPSKIKTEHGASSSEGGSGG